MKYIVDSKLIDDLQLLACAIESQTSILWDILDEGLTYDISNRTRYSKEQILGQADGIKLLARQLDLKAVDAVDL